jgi:hypothetical protein
LKTQIEVTVRPLYSPNLISSDTWFSYLKRNLVTYYDDTCLTKAIKKVPRSIPIHEYQKTFKKWVKRMKLCIQQDGSYLEHLL